MTNGLNERKKWVDSSQVTGWFIGAILAFAILGGICLVFNWIQAAIVFLVLCLVVFNWFIFSQAKDLYLQIKQSAFDLGPNVQFCAPTTLGWVAVGPDWLSSSSSFSGLQRIRNDEIGKIVSGIGPLTEKGQDSGIEREVLRDIPTTPWLYIENCRDRSEGMFLFFRKTSERDEWAKIAHDLAAGTRIDHVRQFPTLAQLLLKSDFVAYFLLILCSISLICGAMAFPVMAKHKGPNVFTLIAPSLNFFVIAAKSPKRPEQKLASFRMEAWMRGGDQTNLIAGIPIIAGPTILTFEPRGLTGVIQRIPLKNVRNVRLVFPKSTIRNRSISDLFRDVPSEYGSIEFDVEGSEPNTHKFQVHRKFAQECFEKLKTQLAEATRAS